MAKRWSLKSRVRLSSVIVLFLLIFLFVTGGYTLWHFRMMAEDMSRRSQELPAAAHLGTLVSTLRMQVSQIKGTRMAEQLVKNRWELQLRRMELFDFSRQPTLESYSLFLNNLTAYHTVLGDYE